MVRTNQNAAHGTSYRRPEDLERIPELARLGARRRLEMRAVAEVLPFAVDGYVLEELIDWTNIPDDPIFQLVFPQPEMLSPDELRSITSLLERDAPREEVRAAARVIQMKMNPHPAGQKDLNVPWFRGERLQGVRSDAGSAREE